MFIRSFGRLPLVAAAFLTLVISQPASAVEMTFYGNQHFKFVSDEGKVILINPWVKGIAVEIAARTGATIFTVAELGSWMQSQIEKFGGSKNQVYRGAISGRHKVGNVTVQLIQAAHGTGISPGNKDFPARYYGGRRPVR